MRLFVCVLLAIICSTAETVSVQAQEADSLHYFATDSVLVVGKIQPIISTIDGRGVQVTPTSVLVERTGSLLAADALSAVSSSLAVRRYGPLGGTAFISYRGLPSEFTAVYRDGVPMPNAQNSLTDVGQLLLTGISRVEVVPSAESILLGGDAIGAAVNFVSQAFDTAHLRMSNSLTNYDSKELAASVESRLALSLPISATLSAFGGGSISNSTGRFPFDQTNGSQSITVMRAYGDAGMRTGFANLFWQANSNDELRFSINSFAIERGLPGLGTTPGFGASQVGVRQADDQTFSLLQYSHQTSGGGLQIAGSYQYQYEFYTQPNLNISDVTRNDILAGYAHWNRQFELGTLYLGLDATQTRLAGTRNRQANGDSIITRRQLSGFCAASATVLGLQSALALRAEGTSDLVGMAILPQVTVTRALSEHLAVHGAFSLSYHPPTMNELYWATDGGRPNPGLLAERGTSLSAAFSARKIILGGISTDGSLTFFRTRVENEIAWLLTSSSIAIPYNVGSILSQGVELRCAAHATVTGFELSAIASYTLLDAELDDSSNFGKEAPYSSPTTGLVSLTVSKRAYGNITATFHYHGHRYTDPGNSLGGMLQPATIIDLNYEFPAIAIWQAHAQISFAILDLMDTPQTEIPGYPLPARTIRISTTLTL